MDKLIVDCWAIEPQPASDPIRTEATAREGPDLSCQRTFEALELNHLKGLPLDEIGRRMHRNIGAVAALIYRGNTRRREVLSKAVEQGISYT